MQRSIDRQAALEQLVAHTLDAIRTDGDEQWLKYILLRGFVGFNSMPDAQLCMELEVRGLRAEKMLDDDMDFGEDAQPDDDWDTRRTLEGLHPEGLGDAA